MAESNQRKITDPIELHDEDPFAELTRIMGFDPRVAVRAPSAPVKEPANEPQAPVVKPQAAAVVTTLMPRAATPVAAPKPVVHDDFAIDLEKELLGEFADFDAPEPLVPASAAMFDAPEFHAPQPVAPARPEAPAARFDQPAAVQPVKAVATAVAQARAVQPDTSFDPVADRDFDDAFAAAFDDLPVATADISPAKAEVQAAEVAPEPTSWTVHEEPAVHQEPVREERAMTVETQPEAAATEFDLDDFTLDDQHFEETVADEIADEIAAQPAEDFIAPPQVVDEPQFETAEPQVEARDAFADVDMDFSAEFEREFAADFADETRPVEPVAGAPVVIGDPWAETAVARAPEPVAAGHADDFELNLEDELGALFHAQEQQSHPQPEAPPAVAPMLAEQLAPVTARQASQSQFDERWAALEADDEEVSVDSGSRSPQGAFSVGRTDERTGDPRRPYSDPALVARHANFQTPAVREPEPAEDLDDLIEAMEHEVHGDHPPAQAAVAPARASEPTPSVPFTSGFATYSQPPRQAYEQEEPASVSYQAAPEIETIDVPETAVAVADDLDLPELAYEQDEQPVSAYDDIDAEFTAAFQDNSLREEPVNQVVRGTTAPAEHLDFDADFDSLYRPSYANANNRGAAPAARHHAHEAYQPTGNYRGEAKAQDFDDFDESAPSLPTARDRFVDLDFDTDVEEEEFVPTAAYHQPQERAATPRRGLLIGAVVGGVALLGGVGALALSFGGGDGSTAPVVVQADDGPVKVKPENPGGTVVPNQDNKVYDAVKGTGAATEAPAQEKLVTTSEEPVDMAAVADNGELPGLDMEENVVPKAEFRVDPMTETDQPEVPAEAVAVTPRKVKTMVVRSDGTLVPREEVEPAAAADTATQTVAAAPLTSQETTGTAAAEDDGPTFQAPGADPVAVKPVETETAAAPEADEVAETASALPPANTAEEPAETAEEPAAAVPKEEAKPEEQVASVEPMAVTAGAWSVQIASQPSAESAKSTYQDLAKRYGKVIGGRGVNIVKAEIAGKGTYWRVRVPAQSRDEAVKLCGDYKAAGGNCFVSK